MGLRVSLKVGSRDGTAVGMGVSSSVGSCVALVGFWVALRVGFDVVFDKLLRLTPLPPIPGVIDITFAVGTKALVPVVGAIDTTFVVDIKPLVPVVGAIPITVVGIVGMDIVETETVAVAVGIDLSHVTVLPVSVLLLPVSDTSATVGAASVGNNDGTPAVGTGTASVG